MRRCLSDLMKIVSVGQNEKAATTVKNVAKLSSAFARNNEETHSGARTLISGLCLFL